MYSRVVQFCTDPVFMRRVHLSLTLLWITAVIPVILFLSTSVPFLVFISVYAVITGHWSSWQSARVEVHQKDDANVQDVLDRIEKN